MEPPVEAIAGPIQQQQQTNARAIQASTTTAQTATALLQSLQQVNLRIRSEYEQRLQHMRVLESDLTKYKQQNEDLQGRVDDLSRLFKQAQTTLAEQRTRISSESDLVTGLRRSIEEETQRLQELYDEVNRTLLTSIDLSEQMATSEQLLDVAPNERDTLLTTSLYTQIMSDWRTVWAALVGVGGGQSVRNPAEAKDSFLKQANANIDAYVATETRAMAEHQQQSGRIAAELSSTTANNRQYDTLRQQLDEASRNWQRLLQELPRQADAVKSVIRQPSFLSIFDALAFVDTRLQEQATATKPETTPVAGLPALAAEIQSTFARFQLRANAVIGLWLLRHEMEQMFPNQNTAPYGDAIQVKDSDVRGRVTDAPSFVSLFRQWARASNEPSGDCILLSQWFHLPSIAASCDAVFTEFTPRPGSVERWLRTPYVQ